MSSSSSSQKSDGQHRSNHLVSETVPTTFSPHDFAKFTAATASGYQPKAQTKPPGFGTSTNSTTTTTSPQQTQSKPMSDFAKDFFAAGTEYTDGLKPPPAQTIDSATFKGLEFVTLDGLQLETRDIYDEISGTFQWEMCEGQTDRCIKFIQEKCADKRVFLISTGSLGRILVPAVHELKQVYCIYIYCADVKANREWSSGFNKVRVVCNDDDQDLLPQLAVDVAQANIEWGDAFMKQNQPGQAKPKYEKAVKNLTVYAKNNNPKKADTAKILANQKMIADAKAKLEQCK